MSSHDDDGQGVIPLSRFRAALARARRGHRAEAILADPHAARLVPTLPVQELYYAIKEVGLEDARELVALASPAQIRGFVDLDAWHRDTLDSKKVQEWLDAALDAGPLKLKSVIEGLDPELVALHIRRGANVYDLTLEEPLPEEPAGHFYPTPDGFFVLDVLAEGDEGRSVEHMVDYLYRADHGLARQVLMSARAELTSELEEWTFRWRAGRMADLGYVDYYEALSVYAFLEPASVRLDERSLPSPAQAGDGEPTTMLPAQLAAVLDAESFFARALGTISDDALLDRLQSLLLLLVNKAMSADTVEPGDVDGAQAVLGRAVGYLSMGLEYLAQPATGEEAVVRAGLALATVAPERLFRVGVSLVAQLKRLAEALRKHGLLVVPPLAVPLADGGAAELLAALGEKRPQIPRSLGGEPGKGVRPFRSLADVARAALAIEELSQVGPAVFHGLGLDRAGFARICIRTRALRPEIRYGTLIRTAAANLALGNGLVAEPLHARHAAEPPMVDAAATTEALSERLKARGLAVPAALPRWISTWLGELPVAFSRKDGVLWKFTWLREGKPLRSRF